MDSCSAALRQRQRPSAIGRFEPIGLKIMKGRSATKDIAGRAIPKVPAFERGMPDRPTWLSPAAKEVWETYARMLNDVAVIKIADGLVFAALCETAVSYATAVQGFS